MHVAVDESGGERGALGVDRSRGTGSVDVFFFADSANDAVDRNHRVGVKNGMVEVSAEEEANVADHQFV